MGIYNSNTEKQSRSSYAGAATGFTTRCICQPLDVLKIRFQLQIEPIQRKSSYSRYRGILQACKDIWRREGVTGFWKGHIPAQFLSVIYGCTQFAAYDGLYKKLNTLLKKKYDNTTRFVAGGIGGCVGTVASYPADVLRTRFSSQGENKIYRHAHDAIYKMYQHEGVRGFFRGLNPSLVQIFPYVGLQFGLYRPFVDLVKLVSHSGLEEGNLTNTESLIAGGLSGGVAKSLVYPFDLVRKRLQVQGFENARTEFGKLESYTGTMDCFRKTVAMEGLAGLFKGLSPSIVKAVLVSGLHFSLYEFFSKTFVTLIV